MLRISDFMYDPDNSVVSILKVKESTHIINVTKYLYEQTK